MEYLIIIGFFIVLIPFWLMINKKSNLAVKITQSFDALTARILKIPQGIYYSQNHTWAFLERSGNAKIGLNDFISSVVGNIKVDILKKTGETINKGEILAEMLQGNKRLQVHSPITGTIINTNSAIVQSATVLNNDPYETGWICAVKPSQWKAETGSFLLAEEASKWIISEIDRFKDFLAISLMKYSPEPATLTLQEGGEIKPSVLDDLDHKIWEDFQKSFLM